MSPLVRPSDTLGGAGSSTLTVIILTFNEHLHIQRCIEMVRAVASRIVVVDSGSTDDTVSIAESLGAMVLYNPWVNYALQFNWALDHALIDTEWVMRLDADEYLDVTALAALQDGLRAAPAAVTGFELRRPTTFLDQRIRHGGMAPWLLRIWRAGMARSEERWMDEHLVLVCGKTRRLPGYIVDYNLNTLTWWTDKHNHYANREAVELLLMRAAPRPAVPVGLSGQARLKRWVKARVYARLPLGVRPFLFWFFRIMFLGGFLDGARGLMFHTLQGLWYRLLVDAKVIEVEHTMRKQGIDLAAAIRVRLGIDLQDRQRRDAKEGRL